MCYDFLPGMLRSKASLGDSVPAFRVKLGANDLNCVDVPLNPLIHPEGPLPLNPATRFGEDCKLLQWVRVEPFTKRILR